MPEDKIDEFDFNYVESELDRLIKQHFLTEYFYNCESNNGISIDWDDNVCLKKN